MSKTLFTLTLIAVLGLFAAAQDSRALPPVTMRENTQGVSTQPDRETAVRKNLYYPPFCPPSSCLYYAGDPDSNYSGANGLFNANYANGYLEGQVWVGVKPDRDATVTGATFVQFLSGGYTVTNPTPFAVQVGIEPGQAGKMICSTSGTATSTEYEFTDRWPQYSYTIKRFSKSCKLKKGRVYYVNLLPTSGNGYGFVVNLPPKPPNHHGWKNDVNDCYWNGVGFGSNYYYVTCSSQGAFSEVSVALTGKERK